MATLALVTGVGAPSTATAAATAPTTPATTTTSPVPVAAATARPQQVASGQSATVSGTVAGAAPGTAVSLSASPYPYTAGGVVGTENLSASGSFSFTVTPDRNTEYTVALTGGQASAPVTVDVVPRTDVGVQALPFGRAGVSIVVFHPRDLAWNGAPVTWSFASPAGGAFHSAPATRVVRLSPYASLLHTTIALPAGRFRFRACFHAPDDQALVDAAPPQGCTGRGYDGGGTLPVGYPGPSAIARAEAYLSTRQGTSAFAVVDSRGGCPGCNIHWRFPSASVVKAMLLTAYLRRLDARGQHTIDAYSASFLYPMIHVSDNNAATSAGRSSVTAACTRWPSLRG